MAEQKLQLIIDAVDKTKAAFGSALGGLDSMQSKAKALEPAFKGMAAVGTASFIAIGAVVGKGVADFIEAERAERQLENAIIQVSKGTMEQVQAVNEVTTALQKKAGVDGDALKIGVAQLSTFGLQSKSVVDLTKSLADLTVNQNGVSAGADAYVGSANIMAKAMRGEFGMLQKMGIRFTEHQQELIKTGTETEKVAALQEGLAQNLRETTDTLGGSAEAKMAIFKEQMGEISESIGSQFLPMLGQIMDKVQPVIDKILEWTSAHPELTKNILLFGLALSGIIAVIGFVGLAIVALSAAGTAAIPVLGALGITVTTAFGAMAATAGIVAGVVVAIGLLIFAAYELYKHWDTVKEWFGNLWTTLKDLFWQSIEAIKNFFIESWNGIRDYIIGLWNGLSENAKGWILLIGTILTGGLLALVIKIIQHWDAIKAAILAAWDAIVGFVKSHWEAIVQILLPGLGTLLVEIIKHWDAIKNAVVSAWQGVKDGLAGVWESIKGLFNSGVDTVMNKLKPLINAINTVLDGASKIGGSVSKSVSGLGGSFKNALGINDGIVQNGRIITTHPDDYLIATKTPGSLLGAGNGGMTLVLSGNTFMGKEGIAEEIGDEILRALQLRVKLW